MPSRVQLKHVSIIDPGAFGVLIVDSIPIAVTLERTELIQGIQTVKIPAGRNLCKLTDYYKGGYKTYEIIVAGHSRILFHKANLEDELDGCIAVGEQFGFLKGKPGILQSGVGFDEFFAAMKMVPSFYLEVDI